MIPPAPTSLCELGAWQHHNDGNELKNNTKRKKKQNTHTHTHANPELYTERENSKLVMNHITIGNKTMTPLFDQEHVGFDR